MSQAYDGSFTILEGTVSPRQLTTLGTNGGMHRECFLFDRRAASVGVPPVFSMAVCLGTSYLPPVPFLLHNQIPCSDHHLSDFSFPGLYTASQRR